jgi:hypothetical protein
MPAPRCVDLKHRLNEQCAVVAPELLRLLYKGHVWGDDQTMPGLVGCRKVGYYCTKEGDSTVVKRSDPSPVAGHILEPDTDMHDCAPEPAAVAAAALDSTEIRSKSSA